MRSPLLGPVLCGATRRGAGNRNVPPAPKCGMNRGTIYVGGLERWLTNGGWLARGGDGLVIAGGDVLRGFGDRGVFGTGVGVAVAASVLVAVATSVLVAVATSVLVAAAT